MFTIFAIGTTSFVVLFPSLNGHRLMPFAASLLVVSIVAVAMDPPPMGTRRNHVAIACPYVFTAIGMCAFRPDGLIPLGAAMFVGSFTAVRLRSRTQIAAHLLLASIALSIPIALGLADASAGWGAVTVIPSTWVLGLCVVVVLEAAERQGDELESLVGKDALTGVGNRRLLHERLDVELPKHARDGHELTVLALDLNGFKALNDQVGHDAGDALLQRVAAALVSVSRVQDTVVRQGGDEFCIVLPQTSAGQATWVQSAIRTALADLDSGATPITTGIGIATFPGDASNSDELLHAADTRLADDKRRADARVASTGESAAPDEPRETAQVERPGGLLARVSRKELAVNPYTWHATGSMYALYSAILGGLCLSLQGNAIWAPQVSLVCVFWAVFLFTREPPALGTRLNHLVIASTYVLGAVMLVAFPAGAGVAFGAAAFIGPLTAVRLISRLQIVAHYTAATLIFATLVVFGLVDQTTGIALLVVALALWGLGFSCVAVLEAAEQQGEALEALVRRDPLTGVGNRRALSEELEFELARHARGRRPLTLLALDLNGFKALNDDVGHAAGDQLLRDVAVVLSACVGEPATVVRQGGDEFCVLLPETSGEEAATTMVEIRTRLARIQAHGHLVTTGIGAATFPKDAVTGEALLRVADERLIESKQDGPRRGESVLRVHKLA